MYHAFTYRPRSHQPAYRHCFTKNEIDYLTKFENKTSFFYDLPKVHQSVAIKKSVDSNDSIYVKCDSPDDLKMRPIVAGPSCPTHRLLT